MHWHAIQTSDATPGTDGNSPSGNLSQDSEHDLEHPRTGADDHGANRAISNRGGHLSVNREQTNLFNMALPSETGSSSNDEDLVLRSVPRPLDVEMPFEAPSIATIAYHQAIEIRHKEHLLWDGGDFNPNLYTPTFVHDILMLPGSLANLLGKASAEDVLSKMTPALLPGYKAHIHSPTLQPSLLPDPNSHVQGMLILGLGKEARRQIHTHYHTHAKRRKVQIEIDLQVLGPDNDSAVDTCYETKRRALQAHVWVWSKRRGGEEFLDGEWGLGEYLRGELGPSQTALRIERDAKGDEDEDGWIGRDVEGDGVESEEEEEREVVYGGPGSLDYERVRGHGFSGW